MLHCCMPRPCFICEKSVHKSNMIFPYTLYFFLPGTTITLPSILNTYYTIPCVFHPSTTITLHSFLNTYYALCVSSGTTITLHSVLNTYVFNYLLPCLFNLPPCLPLMPPVPASFLSCVSLHALFGIHV